MDINVCKNFEIERKRLNLTKKDIADYLQMSDKQVGRWGKTHAIPTDKLLVLKGLGFDPIFVVSSERYVDINNATNSVVHYSEEHVRLGVEDYLKDSILLGWLTKAKDVSKQRLIDAAVYKIAQTAGLEQSFEEFSKKGSDVMDAKKHG